MEVYFGRENNLDPTLYTKLGCLTIVTTLSRGVGCGKAFFFFPLGTHSVGKT